MAQRLKCLLYNPDVWVLSPEPINGGRREPNPHQCPLTSTYCKTCLYPPTHIILTYIHNTFKAFSCKLDRCYEQPRVVGTIPEVLGYLGPGILLAKPLLQAWEAEAVRDWDRGAQNKLLLWLLNVWLWKPRWKCNIPCEFAGCRTETEDENTGGGCRKPGVCGLQNKSFHVCWPRLPGRRRGHKGSRW